MVRVATGDRAALEELLRRYREPLSRFLWRQTGGRDVEDLFQETWLRVVRSAAHFDSSRRFSTWLFQIGVNLCRDWHRRRPPEPVELDVAEPAGGEQATAAGGATSAVEAALDAERLLARLPHGEREVVVLRYYHDLGESDVAAILSIPTGTVKSRMHSAMQRLSKLVRKETR